MSAPVHAMDLPALENSSDVEFEPAPSKKSGRQVGLASIAEIIENAEKDRLSSKRTAKQLEFGSGSPGNRYLQELWVARFNAFRSVALKKNLTNPFNGDDVLRFFDSIIDKLVPSCKGKVAIGQGVVLAGLRVILAYGNFTYSKESGYEFTTRDGVRMQTWMDDATRARRLTKGVWNTRVWLNFMTVSRMGIAWLKHYHEQGTYNWDIPLAKLMSIVLVASLGCRGGDIVMSPRYTEMEFMRYEHIDLTLEGTEAKLEDLRARFRIVYEKGAKDINNQERKVYLRSLNNPEHSHMCPVSLILTHALRHGLVRGSTIQEVLSHAANSANRQVTWLYPNRPVIPAFNMGRVKCELDKPAAINQLLSTIKQMGMVANILSRVYVHALRLGTAKDVAHLPPTSAGLGLSTHRVRQTLGHSRKSYNSGVTDKYVDDPTCETYNERADNGYVDRWGPKFSESSAVSVVQKRATDEEIREWQRINEPLVQDPGSKAARRRAQDGIRRERLDRYHNTAEPDVQKKKKKQAMSQKPISEVNVLSSLIRQKEQHQEARDPTVAKPNADLGTDTDNSFDLSLIDPRLLNDTLEDAEVDPDEMESLHARVFLLPTSQTEDQEIETETLATQALLNDKGLYGEEHAGRSANHTQSINACEFITAYSRINIVSNYKFGSEWLKRHESISFASGIGQYSQKGNSRDDPEPMEHLCRKTPGCLYKTVFARDVVSHEFICNEKRVSEILEKQRQGFNFPCQHDGCSKSFPTDQSLSDHQRAIHERRPEPCPHGCDPEKLYSTKSSFNHHMRRHTGRWPTRCRFPDCAVVKEFQNDSAYSKHLQLVHRLDTRTKREVYMPPFETKGTWEPTSCPVDNCTNEYKYENRQGLLRHFMKFHKIEKEEADTLVSCGYVKGPIAEVAKDKKVWDSPSCPVDGCTKPTQYKTMYGLVRHLITTHKIVKEEAVTLSRTCYSTNPGAEIAPIREAVDLPPCPVDGCTKPTQYKTMHGLVRHITEVHGIKKEDAVALTRTGNVTDPADQTAPKRKVWDFPSCPVDDCTSSTKYETMHGLVRHIVKAHKFESEEAHTLSRSCFSMNPTAEVALKRKKGKDQADTSDGSGSEQQKLQPKRRKA